jgi:hypothetical protein
MSEKQTSRKLKKTRHADYRSVTLHLRAMTMP